MVNKKRRIISSGFSHPLSHVIFDLDQTLFWSERFQKANSHQSVTCVADYLSVSFETAELLLNKRYAKLEQDIGYPPALSTTLISIGIPLSIWDSYQQLINIDNIIYPDNSVIRVLEKMSSAYSLLLYTNMCRNLSDKIIARLQIFNFFQVILTPQDTNSTKPNIGVIRSLEKEGVLSLRTTLSVGDRYEIDIVPICDMGGWGYIVSTSKDLFNLPKFLGLGGD